MARDPYGFPNPGSNDYHRAVIVHLEVEVERLEKDLEAVKAERDVAQSASFQHSQRADAAEKKLQLVRSLREDMTEDDNINEAWLIELDRHAGDKVMQHSESLRQRSKPLTTEQRAILEFMMPAMGEGLTLAHDIAGQLDISPRGCGQKLLALERRGLVKRAIAVKRASMKSDHLYGWELTGLGWEAAL